MERVRLVESDYSVKICTHSCRVKQFKKYHFIVILFVCINRSRVGIAERKSSCARTWSTRSRASKFERSDSRSQKQKKSNIEKSYWVGIVEPTQIHLLIHLSFNRIYQVIETEMQNVIIHLISGISICSNALVN